MSTARRLPHSRTWLRVLVLLFALLVPGAHTEVHAAPVASVETVEYDALDAAVRPPADAVRRAAVPLRPAPLPAPAPHAAPGRPRPAVPGPSYPLRCLRTVVLRC
ncbi:hypothetical protein ABZ848_24230 [Streptomyces sp. NPDC047081]|uniref:hypothetical protein n=1 Tax=Streptomyces sp. NPDC047081 TaxID=3154706 RepID=UPI0033CDADF6